MRWQRKLSKADNKHLKEMGILTLSAFKRTAAIQAKRRKANPHPQAEPCWECRSICEKLGIDI